MKKLEYVTCGEFIHESLVLKYDSEVIYEGYTDDLVTSVTGDVELRLNFGGKNTSSVIARKYGGHIVWIPKMPLDTKDKYKTIIFNLKQFAALWTFLKYNVEDDLSLIKDINADELKQMWLIEAMKYERIDDLLGLSKLVEKKVVALSTNEKWIETKFNQLIIKQWVLTDKILKTKGNWETIVAYLDKDAFDEWKALKMDPNEQLFIHLGGGFCILVLV